MKRLAVVGLACLLSAWQSSHSDLFLDKPEKVADFPATTVEDLSNCVHRAAQSMRSPYIFHVNARADKLEFVITATGESPTHMRPIPPKLELHLMTKGESTTVELKKSAGEDQTLNRAIWSAVERCAHRPEQLRRLPKANFPSYFHLTAFSLHSVWGMCGPQSPRFCSKLSSPST
ncbi:MAG: hypothetical protein ABIU05_09925 [Nitrospirales bacterium]